MRPILFLIAIFLSLPAFAATPTRGVMVLTNGVLSSPSNFWAANSNGINAVVSGSLGFTPVNKAGDAMSGPLFVTALTNNALAASRALVSGSDKSIASSSVTATELGYLAGVTGSLQTQLDGRVLKTGDSMSGALTGPSATLTNGLSIGTGTLAGTGPSWDWSGIRSRSLTLSGNTTLTINNVPSAHDATYKLKVVGNNTHSLAFAGPSIQWPEGYAPSVLPSATNTFYFEAIAGTVYGFYSSPITTSADLAAMISNETGSGLLVFNASPSLVTPTIGSAGASFSGSSSGATALAASAAASGTLTLPAATDTLVGKATSDAFTNKTFDAAATGNTLKTKSYLQLTHPHLADGTGATLGTTATALDYGRPTFSATAAASGNYVEFQFMVPTDIDTAVDLRAKLKFRLNGTDTGTHRYVLSVASVADSAAAAGTVGTAINLDFAGDASGASGDVETVGWTTLTGWAAALTADQLMVVRLARDGNAAQDGSTASSTALVLALEYGSTQ